MLTCTYCERPLICDGCQTEYLPAGREAYEALSQPDTPIICPVCETVLVCRWCKTPYDGSTGGEDGDGRSMRG